MKRSITCLLLSTLLVLPALAGVSARAAGSLAQGTSSTSTWRLKLGAQPNATEQLPLPGPDLAVANWTSNHLQNPDLEDWSSPYSPYNWGIDAPGDVYQWFATEPPWHVHEGSYSLGLQCRAPNHHYTYAYLAHYGLTTSMTNLTLRFDWFLDQNLDPINDRFYLYLALSDTGGARYLYYYLNGTTPGTNSSSSGYYQLHDPPHQWNTFSRNLTADFLAIPAFPKSIDPTLQLTYISFYLYASGSTDFALRAFVDDVRLLEGTTTVIGGSTRDGNFESATWNYWSTAGNRDASDGRQSSTAHSGSWSLNLTAASAGNSSYAYTYAWSSQRFTNLNPGWLSFWWYVTYAKALPTSRTYVYLYLTNETHYFWVLYYLGYGGTSAPWGNDSMSLYLHADQFNATGTWTAFHRNIWQDATAYFHTDEIRITNLYFQVESYQAGSRVTLLVDDCTFVSAALNDAGYEDQSVVGSQIRGWNGQNPAFTVTGGAYAGVKAANLTIPGGWYWSITQSLGERPLNGTRETYLDVMWRLEAYAPNVNTFASLSAYLADSRVLVYYLAASAGSLPSNNSWGGYFNVTSVGTTGAWTAMHRDLVHDYEVVFGTLPDTAVTSIELTVNTASGPRMVLLLDDFYLYDDPAPRVSSVQRNPVVPNHNQPVQVTASLQDQDLDTALVWRRFNGGSWQTAKMSHLAGDVYSATISGQPHNTLVEYYITVNDTWGLTTTALNLGAYWSYTAWDSILPSVGISGPVQASGTVTIEGTAEDAESGLASIELHIDGAKVAEYSASPFNYTWATTTFTNGPHTVTAIASDNAGNSNQQSIIVTVNNAPPIPGFPWGGILLACGAAFSLALVRRRRRS